MTTTTLEKPATLGNPDAAALTVAHTPALVRTGKSLAQLEQAIAHYPDPIRIEVAYLQGFLLASCSNNIEALRATCAKLGHDMSREYYRNLICGDYFKTKTSTWKQGGSAWSQFLEMMAALRRHAQLIERTGKLPFIQTPTYHCISNFITAKRAPSAVCRIGGIIAATGGQTSESFKFYATLNNHGAVKHVEAPASGRLGELEAKIAALYNVGESKLRATTSRRAHIRQNINEARCLIIDNAQVLYDQKAGKQQPAFNWLRELYDDCRPTIILKFTEEFLADMEGAEAKRYFEQFIGRMGGLNSLLRLPDFAPDADLKAIAHAFHLAPSAVEKFLYKWSRQAGRIRIVFDRLQLAQEFAREEGSTKITLDHLSAADTYVPPSVGTFEVSEGGAE